MQSEAGQEREVASHFSDTGNAARFKRHHRDRVLYCDGTGWLQFDGTRWRPAGSEVTRLAKATVAQIYVEANRCKVKEQRKALADWALKSESESRIQAMISLAKCELPVSTDALDQNPWLLNCSNGTLDLQTGEFRAHDPKDLITKLAPVDYDPNAKSSLWKRVISHALPDRDVRHFFQKLAGYTITGITGEDILALIHGPTRTSKGTIQGAMATMLGDYSITCELDVFAERDRAGGPRPELTRMRGARMVSIYETSRRLKLSASLVKTLAGSDPVTARALYKDPITFKPAAKIWIATNNLPNVPAYDGALWERIRAILFDVTIPESERDPTVRSQLCEPEHSAAILAWAVRGCRLWRAEGLKQPDAVREASRVYRVAMDPIARYFEECCILAPHLWTATDALRKDYEAWCREQGETPVGGAFFTPKLRELGCEPKKDNRRGGRGWTGIGISGNHLTIVRAIEQ